MVKFNRKNVRKFKRRGSNLGKRIATVEKQLRAGRETKIARVSGELTISSAINSSGKLINLMPDILNNGDITGNDTAGRIGSEIRLKKLVIKSWLRYAPTDVNNRVPVDEANIMARLMILRQKDQQSSRGLILGTNFVSESLLENGEFSQANEFRNIMSPINRKLFTVKQDRKLKLTNAVDTTDPNSDVEANPYNFKINNKTIRFGKMGKKLTYSTETDISQPYQFPWVYTGGYTTCNGSQAPFNSALLMYDITAYYTDA